MKTRFENWTRSNAQIIGTVFVWVDYRMPLEPLREAAPQRACEAARRVGQAAVPAAGHGSR